jgi:hypothetical protein
MADRSDYKLREPCFTTSDTGFPVRCGLYELVNTIGKGNFAAVKLAKHSITHSKVKQSSSLNHISTLSHKSLIFICLQSKPNHFIILITSITLSLLLNSLLVALQNFLLHFHFYINIPPFSNPVCACLISKDKKWRKKIPKRFFFERKIENIKWIFLSLSLNLPLSLTLLPFLFYFAENQYSTRSHHFDRH